NYAFVADEKIEFKPSDIALMAPAATYSTPFGKLETMEWLPSLPMVPDGSWEPKKDEYKQVGLFEDA
ncbi:hypothetical protein, partial [uncultured Dubosiella sp.]